MKINYLLFVLGPTNSGKTTFLNNVKKEFPEDTYLIQVGKILRAKYPPDYFQGQAAPEKTEKESLEILFSEYEKAREYKYILIDGQPRHLNHVKIISESNLFDDRNCFTFYIWAPRSVRIQRAALRDKGAALDLSLQRMDNDDLTMPKILEAFDKYEKVFINSHGEDSLEIFKEKVECNENSSSDIKC